MARHLELGKQGEKLCMKHFVKLGFKILEQNYWKKWGEIDIIAKKDNVLHFIEVKSVSYETDFDNFIPEENIHKFKKERLKRVINTYLAENPPAGGVTHETKFQIDVAAIFLNPATGESKIRITEDVIL
ncbi:YraN family protein [Patescibacteria group bacterium]